MSGSGLKLSAEAMAALKKLAEWQKKGKLIYEVNTNLRKVPHMPAWILRERKRRAQG